MWLDKSVPGEAEEHIGIRVCLSFVLFQKTLAGNKSKQLSQATAAAAGFHPVSAQAGRPANSAVRSVGTPSQSQKFSYLPKGGKICVHTTISMKTFIVTFSWLLNTGNESHIFQLINTLKKKEQCMQIREYRAIKKEETVTHIKTWISNGLCHRLDCVLPKI